MGVVRVAKATAKATSLGGMLKDIFTNSFVIAVFLGLVLNVTGIYQMLLNSPFSEMIVATLNQATTPIVSMILFILGYDLKINKDILGPILKLSLVKIAYYTIVIIGFFVLFPDLMADKTYMMAPIIYFMCPSGFGTLPSIAGLYQDEDDANFASAFISIFMIFTLIVYTIVVIFIA